MMCYMIIETSHEKPDEPVVFRYIISASQLMNKPGRWHFAAIVRHWKIALSTCMWRKQNQQRNNAGCKYHYQKSTDSLEPTDVKHQLRQYDSISNEKCFKDEKLDVFYPRNFDRFPNNLLLVEEVFKISYQ